MFPGEDSESLSPTHSFLGSYSQMYSSKTGCGPLQRKSQDTGMSGSNPEEQSEKSQEDN